LAFGFWQFGCAFIPDFSQWERPEKFKEEFEKLVRDLNKAGASGQVPGHLGN
jgi:hypothetical protein